MTPSQKLSTDDRTARSDRSDRPAGLRGDERGVSEILGAILVFGLLLAVLVLVQVTAVPVWNQQVEYEHNLRVQEDFNDLFDASTHVVAAGGTETVSVETGVRYPSRVFLLNPPPAEGRLTSVDLGEVELRNVVASGEARDFWNGDPVDFDTAGLRYTPGYSQYRNAPTTWYENYVQYNEFDRQTPATDIVTYGRPLIDGRQVTLVSLVGDVGEQRVDPTSLSLRGLSAPARELTVRGKRVGGTEQPITIEVPTRLSREAWASVLDPELDTGTPGDGRYVTGWSCAGADPCGTLTVTLEAGATYDLRMARVAVGSTDRTQEPAYVEAVTSNDTRMFEGGKQELTVQVRDQFNNPVSGVEVTFSKSGTGDGLFDDSTVTTGADGTAATTFTATGNGTLTVTAAAEFDGQSGTAPVEAATFTLRVGDLPRGFDFGGTINPYNPAGDVILSNVARSGNTYTLTFTNVGSTDSTVSRARLNFYYFARAGTSVQDGPQAAVLDEGKSTETRLLVRGPYVTIPGGVTVPGGSSRDVTVSFYETPAFATPFTPPNSDSFFVLSTTVDGRSSVYFAAEGSTALASQNSPSVDSVSVDDQSTAQPDKASFAVDWDVSDADGNLRRVTVELREPGGAVVESQSTTVSGGSASGTTSLAVNRGYGDQYVVVVTVEDAYGFTDQVQRSETADGQAG